jgi:hypothetical protein
MICSGQFDKGRKFEFTVTANGDPYDVTGCSAVLKGVQNNNSHFAIPCNVSNGKIITALDDTTLSVKGKTVAKLVIYDSSKSYSTQMFLIDVDSALDGDITAADDYSILNSLIEQIHALNESGAILVDNTINANSNNAVANSAVAIALSNKLDNTSGSVSRENIASEAVGSNEIEAKAVTTEKLANKSVTSIKLSNSCVSANNIANNQINSAHLQSCSVTSEKLSDDVKNLINSKANGTDTYTKSEIDAELAKKINEEDVYTAEEVDERFQRILTAGDNIKIDDNKQGKITISADLSKKYDAANVESGSGDLSLYSENVPVTSAKFNYQKVGDFVMLTLTVTFSAATMRAAKSYSLLGLPYRNDIILRKSVITTSKNKLGIAIAANTAILTIITQGEAVAISDGESIQETLIYKIQK